MSHHTTNKGKKPSATTHPCAGFTPRDGELAKLSTLARTSTGLVVDVTVGNRNLRFCNRPAQHEPPEAVKGAVGVTEAV
eukprot:s463_g13.t1